MRTWPWTTTASLIAVEIAWFGVATALDLHLGYLLSGMFGIALAYPARW